MSNELDLINRYEAANLANLSVSGFQSHRFPGRLVRKSPLPPEPVTRKGSQPLWCRDDILEWIECLDRSLGPKGKG